MRPQLLKLLCLLALVACAPLAQAQVYHCVGAHGEPVFSGEPCATATPSKPGAAKARVDSFGGVCPGSPQALQKAITTAFTRHDVNLLAGLILWRGKDQAAVPSTLHSLSTWLEQPLIGITIAYPIGPPVANSGPASAATTAYPAIDSGTASPTGFEISTGDNIAGTRDFGVMEFGGCWWLTFEGIG